MKVGTNKQMDNLISRGPEHRIRYGPEYRIGYGDEKDKRFSFRSSKENLMEMLNESDLGNIASDNLSGNKQPELPNNTENQLNLSEKIYHLELKIRSLEMDNKGHCDENKLLKDRIHDLTEELNRVNQKPIIEMKNHEEERRSWKYEGEQLENRLSMLDSMIRSLNEDKLHMREKISMLEMNLARPVTQPPTQATCDYSDPRDALRTSYPSSNPSGPYFYPNSEIGYTYPTAPSDMSQHSPWDPLLTCELCGLKFPHGEIQQAREHLNSQHPK